MELLPESGIFSMLMQATLMVKLVLLFLVSMSIWCWSIIIFKILLINKAKRQVVEGYEAFLQAEDLSAGLHVAAGRGGQHGRARVPQAGDRRDRP